MLIMEDVDDRVPLKTGTRLSFNNGRSYTVTDVIGMGGGGIVYKAVTPEGRTDAIKEIYPYEFHRDRNDDGSIRFLGTDERDMYDIVCEDARQRESYFSRLTAGRGDNPNVIQSEFYRGVYINDSEQETDIAYLVMNRLVGCTLAEFIDECGCRAKTGCPYRRGGLPDIRTTAAIIRSILYAVKRIHNIPQPGQACDTGYLINDIKAENIYMYGISFADRNSDWFPFIIDYGSVQKLDAQKGNVITEDVKHSAYTEGYASWEMQNPDVLRITPASDLYSVGRIFLYMITGEEFRVTAGDTLTMFADCNDDTNIKVALGYARRSMKETCCSDYLFETVTRIIEKSITNNAADRYQTADEFIKDIDNLIDRLEVKFYIVPDILPDIYEDIDEFSKADFEAVDDMFKYENVVFTTGWNRQIREKFAVNYIQYYKKSHDEAKVLYKSSENCEASLYKRMLNDLSYFGAVDANECNIKLYLQSEQVRNSTLKEAVAEYGLVVIDELKDDDKNYVENIAELANEQTKILVVGENRDIWKKDNVFFIGKNVTDKLIKSYKKSYTEIVTAYILTYEENEQIAYNNAYNKPVQNYNIKINGKVAYSLDFDYPQARHSSKLKIKRYLSPTVRAILLLDEEKSAEYWGVNDNNEKYTAIQYAIWCCAKASEVRDSRNSRLIFDMSNIYPISEIGSEKFELNNPDLMSADYILNNCIDKPQKVYRIIEAAKKIINAAEVSRYYSDARLNVKTDNEKMIIKKHSEDIYYAGPFMIKVNGVDRSCIMAKPILAVGKCNDCKIVDKDGTEVISLHGEKEIYVKITIDLSDDCYDHNNSNIIDIMQMCFKVDGVIKEGIVLGIDDKATEYAALLERKISLTYDVAMTTSYKSSGLITDEARTTGNLRIIEVDQCGDRISGAEFKIMDSQNDNIVTKKADSNGLAELYNIETGEYTIIQTKGPEGYEYENRPQTLQVISNRTSTITYVNVKRL